MSLKPRDLRELTLDELSKKLHDLSTELLKARLESRSRRSPANPKWRNLRRDVARIMTIMKEKETAAHVQE